MRLDEYKRLNTIGKSFGVESSIISPQEAKKLFPLLDENIFYGALYSPSDGVIDPAMMVNSLIQSAKSNGAKVMFSYLFTKFIKIELKTLKIYIFISINNLIFWQISQFNEIKVGI